MLVCLMVNSRKAPFFPGDIKMGPNLASKTPTYLNCDLTLIVVGFHFSRIITQPNPRNSAAQEIETSALDIVTLFKKKSWFHSRQFVKRLCKYVIQQPPFAAYVFEPSLSHAH